MTTILPAAAPVAERRAPADGPAAPAEDEAWTRAKETRRYSPLASLAASGGAGVLGGVAVASLLTVALRGKLAGSFAGRAALAGAGFGVLGLLGDLATRGSLGSSLLVTTHGQRHQIGYAVANLHRPWIVGDARGAYRDSRELQQERYGDDAQIDNGVDALRHAYGGARLASTLVHERGMSVTDAHASVDEIGRAHELDGMDNNGESARMDEHNNLVGARIGTDLLAELGRVPTRDELARAVDDAIAEGDLLVIEQDELRDSRASDLPEGAR